MLGFPCYWGLGGGVEGSAKFKGTRDVADETVPLVPTFALQLKPQITGKFGAGVDKLLYAEINGKGSAPILFETSDKYLKIDFEAEFGWKAGIWILSVSGIIWEKERKNETKRKENQPKASSQIENKSVVTRGKRGCGWIKAVKGINYGDR